MNTNKAIVTLEVVKFHNDFLEVVRVAANNAVGRVDGEYWVSVRKVCENLDIDFKYQHQKLKSDPAYDTKLIKVKTAGGMQEMFCIPLEKLNGWLFTINPNKVKPEVKQKLIAYKNECFKVLYNHFIQKVSTQPPAGCPATQFDSRINGYKSQLAQRKKQIEEMQWRIVQLEEELKEYKRGDHNRIMLEHNILDLTGSYARLREKILGSAEAMELVASSLKERIETIDHFIKSIERYMPAAKDVKKTAIEHTKTQNQWMMVSVKHKIKGER